MFDTVKTTDKFDYSSLAYTDKPPRLWRVQLPESMSKWLTGIFSAELVAGDGGRHAINGGFANEEDFAQAVACHWNWGCRRYPGLGGPFISAFSDREHAYNWARRMRKSWLQGREDNEEWPGVIYEIDLSVNLPFTVQKPVLFESSYLRDKLDIVDELGQLYQYSSHEYLILYRVPAKCIVRTFESPDEFFAATANVPPFRGPYRIVFWEEYEERINSKTRTVVTCSHHEVLTDVP